MEFNTLVRMQLFPILQKYGFEIAEEFKNIVRFQSSVLKINVVFNNCDRSYLVEIGRQGETLYPLNDNVVKEYFNYQISIEQVSLETFVKNISLLFETKEGAEILKGNIAPFIKFELSEINDYNNDLLEKQALEVASKAWKANDYATFVDSIDKVGISKISRSYQLKYKIAKQKL